MIQVVYFLQELESKTNNAEAEEKETCERIISDTNVSIYFNRLFQNIVEQVAINAENFITIASVKAASLEERKENVIEVLEVGIQCKCFLPKRRSLEVVKALTLG